MATYKSEEIRMMAPAETVYEKLSNLQGLGEMLRNVPEDKIPADKKEMFDQIIITPETIAFPAGPVGAITLRKTECDPPRLIRLDGQGTPVPMALMLHIAPVGAEESDAQVEIDIQIPALLKPMIGGTLQKMVDQFAQVLRAVPFA